MKEITALETQEDWVHVETSKGTLRVKKEKGESNNKVPVERILGTSLFKVSVKGIGDRTPSVIKICSLNRLKNGGTPDAYVPKEIADDYFFFRYKVPNKEQYGYFELIKGEDAEERARIALSKYEELQLVIDDRSLPESKLLKVWQIKQAYDRTDKKPIYIFGIRHDS